MKIRKILMPLITFATICSCDYLDVPPINIIQDDAIFKSESGVKSYMTTLYYDLPIEDFRFSQYGFNVESAGKARLAHVAGEAMITLGDELISIGDGTWWGCWDYGRIRRVNYFIKTLPSYKSNFSGALADAWLGEAYFIRAYCYFAMTKRYGGVPILKEPQEYTEDIESLRVPRNTEKDCYDFIAEDLDRAVELLPDNEVLLGRGRATKYAALALKSRAMLYAGSIARYGNLDLGGIVGIDAALADGYFEKAYQATKDLEKTRKFSLYRVNSNKEQNYADLFMAESSTENIFIKYFQRNVNAHGYDTYSIPYQYQNGGYSSYFNPPLEFVERFEHKDGTPANFTERGTTQHFADPSDLFKDMDARFWGSIIYPNAMFKNEKCDIQGGLITKDGTEISTAGQDWGSSVYKDGEGNTYHIKGKSGIARFSGNGTGFYVRKYLNENLPKAELKESYSEQHWIDMRYAEVLLNGIEAAIESGKHLDDALIWINDIRDRAGVKALTSSDLTIERVRNERRIELAFENHTYWDLRRWRIADEELESKQYTGLAPYLDLRDNTYTFKVVNANDQKYTFNVNMYYERIPDGEIAKNGKLVQNPYYN